MKKVALLLSICLLACSVTAVAQKKATAAKKTTTSKAAPKKAAAARTTKKTPAAKTNQTSAKPHIFEGTLLYRNYEHHSAVIRKFSGGQAYNGERSVRVTLKGNAAHIVDESMHIHTIVLPDVDKFYIYSDVSKQGFTAKASEILPKFFSVYDPNVETSPELPKKSTLKATGRQETYRGDRCKVYAGQLTAGESALTDVELWYSDRLLANKSYRYLFSGMPVPGLVRKGIISQSGKFPLLGNVKSTVASELVALKEYKVAASEMAPPKGVTIAPYTKDTQLHSFHKQSAKALKKAKLYPQNMKTKEVDYALRNQWDFADEWLAKNYGTVSQEMTWSHLGESLFSTAAAVANLGGSKTASTTALLEGAAAIIGGKDVATAGGDGSISSVNRARGSGRSNAQVKALERKMDGLNQQYVSLTKQYNSITQQGQAIANEKNAEFARQVNSKNPTAKKGRVNVQAPRAGQGMGRKVEAAIKTGRQERAALNKASRDREPVAVEIAKVASEMAQLEQNIYDAKVQANLFDNSSQRMASATAAVSNFRAWSDHLDKLARVSSGRNMLSIADEGSKINALARNMNDDIRRLKGMSEEQIREENAKARQKVAEGRAKNKEYYEGVVQRAAKMDARTQHNNATYLDYLSELKAMENGTQPYDKKKARQLQKWMKNAATSYEKSTGQPLPGRDKSWEDWTPFGK